MSRRVTRRAALGYGGAAGATLAVGGLLPQLLDGLGAATAQAASSCTTLTPDLTEGPYWVDLDLHRSDVTANTANATSQAGVAQAGVPLTLTINVIDASKNCAAYNNAYVDIWHANAYGIYSDEASQQSGGGDSSAMETTTGQNFLRGYQVTGVDAATGGAAVDGQVVFKTIWPGWYTSRAIHIHVRVRTYNGTTAVTNYTTQIFFSDTDNDHVLAGAAPYNTRTTIDDPTTDESDTVLTSSAYATNIVAVTGSVAAGYAATFTITIDEGATSTGGGTGATGPAGTGGRPGAPPTGATGSTGTTTTGTTGSIGTTGSSGSGSGSGAASLTGALASVTCRHSSGSSRRVTAQLTTSEAVTVTAQLTRSGKRLGGTQGHLTKGTHALSLVVPRSVTAGAATLAVTIADAAGATKTLTHAVHIPSR